MLRLGNFRPRDSEFARLETVVCRRSYGLTLLNCLCWYLSWEWSWEWSWEAEHRRNAPLVRRVPVREDGNEKPAFSSLGVIHSTPVAVTSIICLQHWQLRPVFTVVAVILWVTIVNDRG